MSGHRERNRHMAELYERGLTLEEIGRLYGVTRERVRQITTALGVDRKLVRQKRADTRRLARMSPCPSCGELFDPGQNRTQSCGEPECHPNRKYTNAELLTILRHHATRLGRTPGMADLNGKVAPWFYHYFRWFGSLRRAQELAGLKPTAVGAPGHKARRGTL